MKCMRFLDMMLLSTAPKSVLLLCSVIKLHSEVKFNISYWSEIITRLSTILRLILFMLVNALIPLHVYPDLSKSIEIEL